MTHFVDMAAGMLLRLGPTRSRIFPDGWGDQATLDMLSDRADIARTLVTQRFPLDAVHDAFGAALDKSTQSIKVHINPNS